MMKNVNPRNKLRFIWFGGEELGLLGSAYYVNNLTPSEASHIGYDLDADVTATRNYVVGVLDPAGVDLFSRVVESTFPNRVYKASTIARDQAISDGVRHEGDVREQQRGLQEEAADRLGARSTLGGQITADGMAPGSIARRHADSRQAHDR